MEVLHPQWAARLPEAAVPTRPPPAAGTRGLEAPVWCQQAIGVDPARGAALVNAADEHRRANRLAEAAKLYRAAHSLGPLTGKALYRLGEVLIQDGQRAEGRQYLAEVLQHSDTGCHAHAMGMMAMSHAMDQNHDEALECCRRAEELHARSGRRSADEVRVLRALRGLSLLRRGDLEGCVAALSSASQSAVARVPGRSHWDELQHCTAGLAEALRGNFAAATWHVEAALGFAGDAPSADMLACAAFLRHVQGDLDGAEDLLLAALDVDRDSPIALLRMGHLLLCRRELDRGAQFLQKCLQQPTGSLAFGASEKGAAHLYLCAVHHLRSGASAAVRGGGAGAGPVPGGMHVDQMARDHFKSGFNLQPDFRNALADVGLRRPAHAEPATRTPGALLVSGSPPRMGAVHLPADQASVLLHYAQDRGLVHLAVLRPANAPAPAADVLAVENGQVRPLSHAAPLLKPLPPQCGLGLALSGSAAETATPSNGCVATLLGTNSTTAPSGAGLSRAASDAAFFFEDAGSANMSSMPSGGSTRCCPSGSSCAAVASTATAAAPGAAAGERPALCLPQDKVLALAEMEFGECISRGEVAVVYRGALHRGGRRRDIVVKMLQEDRFARDDQAASELIAEIRMIAGLSHPRLVTFVGACLDFPHLALVTELAPGGNLHQALHVRKRQLSRHERFQLATELLEGVRYLHARQPPIAHLDLKTMNLVLDATGQHLQICDFGLSRAICGGVCEGSQERRSCGGSPRYMAPECHDCGLGPLTEKADVWSSGCCLIEIFGACLPYAECSNIQQIVNAMLVCHCGPEIPEGVEPPVRAVIASMLAFAARQRLDMAQGLLQLQAAASSTENKSRFMWIP